MTTIPHSIEQEENLLGAMVLSKKAIETARDILDPEDFYNPNNGIIFHVILDLYGTGHAVDASTVVERLREQDSLDRIGGPGKLIELTANSASTLHAETYAQTIANHSARRKLIAIGAQIVDEAKKLNSPGDILDTAHAELAQVTLPIHSAPDNLYSVDEWLARPASAEKPWVIPGLLRQGWRVLAIGVEGAGKSLLAQQIALSAAQGVHPFAGTQMPPIRTLMVDLENPDDRISSGFNMVQDKLVNLPTYQKDQAWLWHQETGINIRKRVDRAKLESVLEVVRPQLMCIGPLYKMYSTGSGESDEIASRQVMEVLDDLRGRFGFALFMEHHAPKSVGGVRDYNPYGSSLWLRWPEFGITLVPDADRNDPDDTDPDFYRLGRFRGDRAKATWPDRLEKNRKISTGMPWIPVWDNPVQGAPGYPGAPAVVVPPSSPATGTSPPLPPDGADDIVPDPFDGHVEFPVENFEPEPEWDGGPGF